MKGTLTLLLLALMLSSCDRVKAKTKSTINEGGEVAGKSASEFFEGVSEGVDRTLECEILISPALKDKGLDRGKFSIESDVNGGSDNLLSIYLIFNKDLKDTVLVKAYDKTGLENGRTKVAIEGKAGDAKYYDFIFDKRTYIEFKSKVVIE